MSHPTEIQMTNDILISCIGNGLCGDDRVGTAVYQSLENETLPPNVKVHNEGLCGMGLLEHLHGQHTWLVIDAVQLGAQPGHVHIYDWNKIPVQSYGLHISAHSIGIEDTVRVGQALQADKMPRQIMLIGIEGRLFNELGEPMSNAVSNAVPKVVRYVHSIVLEASYALQRTTVPSLTSNTQLWAAEMGR